MNHRDLLFNPITGGIICFFSGSLLHIVSSKIVAKKPLAKETVTETKIQEFHNWGGYIGIAASVLFNFREPLINVFKKKT